MSQYNAGTVAVTNGSATVTGTGTLFSANVTAGDFFTVVGDNAFYTVGAVDSDTQLTLTATYAGVTAGGKAYTLVKDFTTNFGFPVPNQGDIETALVVKRAIEEIDSELNTAGLGGDGREWIDLKDTPSFVNVTQFTIPTDKTANYHINRRIRCSDASTLYGRITATSFAASETTVTVALDSGSLSASLSAVALGIASAATPAITGDGVVGGTPLLDAIGEYTAGAGVTIDSVRLKDQRVENLLDPVAPGDAATKSYVDGLVVSGVYWKQPVRVATTANITLSGEQTIDGVLTSADRVLVKNQATGSENGIYVSAAGAWARAADADSDAEVTAGIAAWVNEGTAAGDTGWTLTTDDPITLGATALTFTQFSGGGGVSEVTGSAPITSSGGGTPDIAITAATTGAAGSMSSADKSKLNGVEASADVTDEANVRAALAALAGNPVLQRSTATAVFLDLKSGVSSGNAAFIRFRANDSASNVTTYGQIESTILDATDGSEDARLDFLTEVGGTIANRVFIGAGLFTPGATGGDKGTNSINASAVYDDDTLLSCYVFDAALDGVIDVDKWDAKVPDRIIPATFEDRETTGPDGLPIIERIELTPETTVFRAHQPARAFDTAMLDPDVFAAHWKSRRHLPALPQEAAFDPVADKLSIGDWAQRLLETVECQAVHIDRLNQRIKALEGV